MVTKLQIVLQSYKHSYKDRQPNTIPPPHCPQGKVKPTLAVSTQNMMQTCMVPEAETL